MPNAVAQEPVGLAEPGAARQHLRGAAPPDDHGKIVPGVGLSTRGLALEMGVSQMPVRDALSRLAAEGAVAIRSKRKIEVPP